MINSKGKCSFDQNQAKGIAFFDKAMADIKEKREATPPKEEIQYTEEERMLFSEDFKEGRKLGSTTMADFYFDRGIITYEQYLTDRPQQLQARKNKKNAR